MSMLCWRFLFCKPRHKKSSIKLATPSSIVIPAVTPPAPPPSRAQLSVENDEADVEEQESALEVNTRLRAAGHTPGPELQVQGSSAMPLASHTSLPDTTLEHPSSPTRKTWSNEESTSSAPVERSTIIHTSLTSGNRESEDSGKLRGDLSMTTHTVRLQYSEDVADRNLRSYGGTDRSNTPSAHSNGNPIVVVHSEELDNSRSALFVPKVSNAASKRRRSDTDNDSPSEYDDLFMTASDLGRYSSSPLAQNQTLSRQQPDKNTFNTREEQYLGRDVPLLRHESSTHSTSTSNRTPTADDMKDRSDFASPEGSQLKEDDSGNRRPQVPDRKTSATPSVGVSRYSTARASIPSSGSEDAYEDYDRAAQWKGFGM